MIQALADLPSRYPRAFSFLWKCGGSLVAVVLLLMGTVQFTTLLAHEEETFFDAYDDPGIEVLQVASDAGSVDVVGVEGDVITVRSDVSDGLVATDHQARVEGNRLLLTSRCPWPFTVFCEVDYTIEVPRHLAVVVDVDNGSVTVRGVDGGVDVSAGNGGVELADVGGTIEADAGNGSVTASALRAPVVDASAGNGSVRLSWLVEPTGVEARAGNGGVELVLPDTPVAYRIDFDAGNGSVDAQVRTDPSSDRTLYARAGNGSVVARYP